jgi:hypothetical protein
MKMPICWCIFDIGIQHKFVFWLTTLCSHIWSAAIRRNSTDIIDALFFLLLILPIDINVRGYDQHRDRFIMNWVCKLVEVYITGAASLKILFCVNWRWTYFRTDKGNSVGTYVWYGMYVCMWCLIVGNSEFVAFIMPRFLRPEIWGSC